MCAAWRALQAFPLHVHIGICPKLTFACPASHGLPVRSQAIALAKRPHVVVGTPGRVVDHLSNTKGFSLKSLQHLVLDEADRLLNMDFEQEIDQILKVIPKVGGIEYLQLAPSHRCRPHIPTYTPC